ncbi:MAG: hypothetical protein OXU70_08165 [Gammaproteobacteria bacterium]|nr:hypothetical protein [Gammaproteobacteria bacterium]
MSKWGADKRALKRKGMLPRRLPPRYRFWTTQDTTTSSPDSSKNVVKVISDDRVTVLSGSVFSVGQHNAVEVVDHCLREIAGEFHHADTRTMADLAWKHYKLKVNWWHRNVTAHATA